MDYELYHHGILGMKWGIRRYQNKDGSLTPEGKARLAKKEYKVNKSINSLSLASNKKDLEKAQKKVNKLITEYTYFIRKLALNRMSDAEILDELQKFKFDTSYISLVNQVDKINSGKSALSDKTPFFEDLGKIGKGVGAAAGGIVGVIGIASAIQKLREAKGNT